MAICAALGSRAHHDRLAERVTLENERAAALFALAFSGDARQVPLLIAHLRDENVLHAKLALQAIAAIIGLDLRDDAFAVPDAAPEQTRAADQGVDASDDAEAHAALPPLEEDDLDANLIPQPEDALPTPDADAIEQFWKQARRQFDSSRRYLAGEVFSAQVLLQQLEQGPLRWRHVLALSLGVRTAASPGWTRAHGRRRSGRR